MALTHASRDPYYFPRLQGDDDYTGKRPPQTVCYPVPTHLAQRQPPWNRISNQHTLSSARRQVYHFDPSAPCDDLDFVLKSTYNQHKELLRNKNEVVFQPETFTDDHGRVLKNRIKAEPGKKMPLNHPLIVSSQKNKEDINSVKNAVASHHTETTNKGYSRRPDGGFYCS